MSDEIIGPKYHAPYYVGLPYDSVQLFMVPAPFGSFRVAKIILRRGDQYFVYD